MVIKVWMFVQIDLRNGSSIIEELSENNQSPVTFEEGERLAEEIGAVKYVECSALTKESLNNVFDEATETVFKQKTMSE